MYKHSVRIDRRKCVGCTNCIKTCPTEAIRVQKGKAMILDDRCIDCGNCLTACPHDAMVSVTSPFNMLNDFKYNIVIPSAALASQFRNLTNLDDMYEGLYAMGFDAVYEEAKAAEIIAEATRRHLRSGEAVFPLIDCSCPVLPRLVTALFPNLIDHLTPFVSPTEAAARIAKAEFCEKHSVLIEEVGAYYVTPCAAKMTHIKNPMGVSSSEINGVFPVRDMYAKMISLMGVGGKRRNIDYPAGAYGIESAAIGGWSAAVGTKHYLAVDGVSNIIACLEEIDNERLTELLLLEAMACPGGCVGGPLVFENQFVARNRNRRIANSLPRFDLSTDEHIQKYVDSPMLHYDKEFEPRNILQLSENVVEAIRMMERLEQINKNLPGLDCGSCGSPSCRTLAEDIVKGQAVEMDCIFKLRDKVRQMAQEMVDLASAEKRG